MSDLDMERGGRPMNGKVGAAGGEPAADPSPFDLKSDSRARREWTAWILPVFAAANLVIFLVAMFVNNCPRHDNPSPYGSCVARFLHRISFEPLRQNPLFGPSSDTLEKLGALVWEKVVHQHEGWRLITCIWLHSGVIHLLVNMFSVVFIGIRLEQRFGFVRIGIIFLVSGFGGSILSSLFIRNSISVGASGAWLGLLGALLSVFILNWTIYSDKATSILALLLMNVFNLTVGIRSPQIDNFAQIGGFLTGFLLGFVLLLPPQFCFVKRHNLSAESLVKSKHKAYQYVLCVIALLLLISGFVVGLVMLFRGVNGNDHCKWCHYIT